jgi:hypothetical protein
MGMNVLSHGGTPIDGWFINIMEHPKIKARRCRNIQKIISTSPTRRGCQPAKVVIIRTMDGPYQKFREVRTHFETRWKMMENVGICWNRPVPDANEVLQAPGVPASEIATQEFKHPERCLGLPENRATKNEKEICMKPPKS